MGCGCKTPSKELLKRRREVIVAAFETGDPSKARTHRWSQCAHATECGLACPNLDKLVGEVPSCVDAETKIVHAPDLYSALKREDFHCPEKRF